MQCGRKKAHDNGHAESDLLTTSTDLADAVGRWPLPDTHGASSSTAAAARLAEPVTQLSIAIATCCRFQYLAESVPLYLRDPHVAEVIVTDDCRTDVAALGRLVANSTLTPILFGGHDLV